MAHVNHQSTAETGLVEAENRPEPPAALVARCDRAQRRAHPRGRCLHLQQPQADCGLVETAERSTRRKATPFRSALSMLTFYINRAGKNLPSARKKTLMQAKDELRKQFGKD
jgi:Protein of unknown function (DUF3175)